MRSARSVCSPAKFSCRRCNACTEISPNCRSRSLSDLRRLTCGPRLPSFWILPVTLASASGESFTAAQRVTRDRHDSAALAVDDRFRWNDVPGECPRRIDRHMPQSRQSAGARQLHYLRWNKSFSPDARDRGETHSASILNPASPHHPPNTRNAIIHPGCAAPAAASWSTPNAYAYHATLNASISERVGTRPSLAPIFLAKVRSRFSLAITRLRKKHKCPSPSTSRTLGGNNHHA